MWKSIKSIDEYRGRNKLFIIKRRRSGKRKKRMGTEREIYIEKEKKYKRWKKKYKNNNEVKREKE